LWDVKHLIALPPEGAALGQASLATGGLAQHGRAAAAEDNSLRVAEYGGDVEATLALHVHEERVGRLNKPLQLVLPQLEGRGRVEHVIVAREDHGYRSLKLPGEIERKRN